LLFALYLEQPMLEKLPERGFRDGPVRRESDRPIGEVEAGERFACGASGLNGKTLRWFLLTLKPSSGRFLYLNAGIP
jgi:hypothetical protein